MEKNETIEKDTTAGPRKGDKVQVAQAKAPVAMGARQADQPVGDVGVLLAGLGLVAEASLAHREGLAGVADGLAFMTTVDPGSSP